MRKPSLHQTQGGSWHFDTDRFVTTTNQGWEDWRGYGTVLETQDTSRTRHRVLRGMHGDRLASGATRAVEVPSLNDPNLKHRDWNWLAGATFDQAQLSSGGSPVTLVGTVHTYRIQATVDDDTNAGNDPHAERAAVWTGEETTTERRRTSSGGYAQRRTTTGYNAIMLWPERLEESGWMDATGDERCTKTTYAAPNFTEWMLDYPATETLVGGTCASSSAPELRASHTAYDNGAVEAMPTRGNPTTQGHKLTATTWADTTTGYDGLGRPTSVTDPLGRLTTTSFSPAVGLPTTMTTTALAHETDPARRHVTTTNMVLERGVPNRQIDPNGKVTTFGYDALGRSVSVRLPTEQPAGEPNSWEFSYAIDPGRAKAPVVRTRQLQSAGSTPVFIDSWTIYDSLLRERQIHRLSGAADKVTVTHTDYDQRGNPTFAAPAQAVSSTAPGSGVLTPSAPWENHTQTLFDELNRPFWEIYRSDPPPAGGENPPEQYEWSTFTTYGHNTATVTRDRGGDVTTTSDAYDRVTEVAEQTTRGSNTNRAVTTYGYNLAGDLLRVTDPDSPIDGTNPPIIYSYDLAGRRTQMVDPDAGTWVYGYDAVGNQTRVQDPRPEGNATYTNYDALNRPIERRETDPTTGRLLATWAYDAPNQKGLLDSSTSFHRRPNGEGDEAFITDIGSYDDRSRPTGKTYVVFADRGGLFGAYPIVYAYDRADHVTSTIYPQINDANGQEVLPAEWLVTDYNNRGLPAKLDSSVLPAADESYVNAAGYDERARPVWFEYGQATGGLWRFWNYDTAQRLAGTSVYASIRTDSLTLLQDRRLAYDQTQNITRRTTTLGGQEWVDCYKYDDRNRLTRAYTTGHTDPCATSATSAAGTGDNPYDQSFDYTIDGNMTQRVDNVTASNPTTYDYSYTHPGSAAGKPNHGPAGIDSSVSGEDFTYEWDQAGQLTRRQRSPGDYDTLVWTADRRLDRIQEPNDESRDSFAYDADGNRVLRQNNDRTTIYIEGHEISANGGGGVTAVRTYTFGGQAVATRTRDTSTATDALEYLVSDNQGSVELSVKAGENTPSAQRTYQPYGTHTGSEFLTDHGWVGQVEDDRTKLNYLNARYYDPHIGRFISPDPLADLSRPQTINPYSYGLNSPSTMSDPSGLCGEPASTQQPDSSGEFLAKQCEGSDTARGTLLSGLKSFAKGAAGYVSRAFDGGMCHSTAFLMDPGGCTENQAEGAKALSGLVKGFREDPIGTARSLLLGGCDQEEDGWAVAGCLTAHAATIAAFHRATSGAPNSGGSLSGSALASAGRAAEDAVSARIGIPRNVGAGRATVPGSGPGGFRVPDFRPSGDTGTIAIRGTVVEVKDLASLSSSPQLRDLVGYAQSQGVPLEIFTNATLPQSGELYNWIRTGQVVIEPL